MSYIPIFHLTIPAVWVAVLLAAAVVKLFMRFFTGEKIGEWYWNALTFYILTWKLSYSLFHFENFRNMPLSILYFNGGLYGHFLGIVVVSIYLIMAQKKQWKVAKQSVFSWLLFFLSYQAILQSFEKNVVEAILHTLLLIISILAIRFLAKRTDVPNALLLAALLTLELLISSAFGSLWSWQNATFILLAIVTSIMYIRFEQKGQTL